MIAIAIMLLVYTNIVFVLYNVPVGKQHHKNNYMRIHVNQHVCVHLYIDTKDT